MRKIIEILPIFAISSFALEWAWQALFYEGQPFASDLYHYRYVIGFSLTSLYFAVIPKSYYLKTFGILGAISGLSRIAYRLIRDIKGLPDYTNNQVWWVFFILTLLFLYAKYRLEKKWK